MFVVLRFFVWLLLGLRISSSQDCPEDVCPQNKPTVDETGKITMTIYYDSDAADGDQWNHNMVLLGCEALDQLPRDKFTVEFVIGAGSRHGDHNQLLAKNDIEADRHEACAVHLLNPLNVHGYVCCHARAGDVDGCKAWAGIPQEVFDDCVDNHRSDALLLSNGDKRRNAGIPGCHVPEFAFNGVVDRCINILKYEELIKALCEIFRRGNVVIAGTC